MVQDFENMALIVVVVVVVISTFEKRKEKHQQQQQQQQQSNKKRWVYVFFVFSPDRLKHQFLFEGLKTSNSGFLYCIAVVLTNKNKSKKNKTGFKTESG